MVSHYILRVPDPPLHLQKPVPSLVHVPPYQTHVRLHLIYLGSQRSLAARYSLHQCLELIRFQGRAIRLGRHVSL